MHRQNLFACLIILPIAFCAWLAWKGLQGPLIFDDLSNLAPIDVSSSSAYTDFILGNQSGAVNRVVSMASFAANHWFDGQFVAFSLKTTNLAIHILCGCLIFWISRRLLEQNLASDAASISALAITSLWLIQPLNLGLSFYAVQRMAQLSCLFVLLGITFYIQWRIDRLAGKSSPSKLLLAVICYPLAVFSKENGILLPLLIVVIEAFFLTPAMNSARWRLTLIGLMGAAFLSVATLMLFTDAFEYSQRPFTLQQRVLTQPIVLLEYVRLLVFPLTIDVAIFNDDYEAVKSITNFATLACGIAILLLIVAAFIAPQSRSMRPIYGGVLFFFIAHAAESTIVPLELYFEHRNYLPSFGLYVALVCALSSLSKRFWKKDVSAYAAMILVSVFAMNSAGRAQAWSSYPAIVVNAYQNHPSSRRAAMEMVSLLAQSGQFQAALKIGNEAAALNANNALVLNIQSLFVYCQAQQEPPNNFYDRLKGPIDPLNFIELSNAMLNFVEMDSQGKCQSVAVAVVIKRLAEIVDEDMAAGRISAIHAWNIDYYLIDYFRRTGSSEIARARLLKSIELGNEKAALYAEDFSLR